MLLEHILGQGWEITPAGGATGEAFFAKHQEKKLFLKRNSSPFLAVLSAEGIVPKLVWTKRMENGDVITAQEWLNSRELKPDEMNQDRVAKLLKKIHTSKPLLTMLQRLGMAPFEPEMMLAEVETCLDSDLLSLPIIMDSIQFLQDHIDQMEYENYVVCHGDINHNNWLLTDEVNQLYLIDWDGPMIADPALDIGMLLYLYISNEDWNQWLDQYGIEETDSLHMRMKWYVISQILLSIQWHKEKSRLEEMNHWIDFLESIV